MYAVKKQVIYIIQYFFNFTNTYLCHLICHSGSYVAIAECYPESSRKNHIFSLDPASSTSLVARLAG